MVVAVATAVACGGSSSSSSIDDTHCVLRNGEYTCLGRTWPVCPSTGFPGQACDTSEPDCMGCIYRPAGNTCHCSDSPPSDAGIDGPTWQCIGTGYTCE